MQLLGWNVGLKPSSTPRLWLASRGLSEFNAGGDYNAARYWRPSNPATLTSPPVWASEADHFAQFTRAGSKWAFNAAGVLVQYSANVPAFEWQGGKRRYLNEGPSTRLSAYPASPLDNWGLSGSMGTKTPFAGSFLGVFSNACTFASGGNDWNRVERSIAYSLVSGTTLSWTMYYRSGTSGSARVVLRNHTASTETLISGTPGSLAVTATAAGAATITEQRQAPDGTYMIRGTWTANANGSDIRVGCGPNSSTVGQSIVVVGGWLESSPFPTSPILDNPTTTSTRAADAFRKPTSAEAVYQLAAATALIRGGNLQNLAGSRLLGGASASRLIGGNVAGNVITVGAADSLNIATGLTAPIASFGLTAGWDAAGRAGAYNGGAAVSSGTPLDTVRSKIYLGRTEEGQPTNVAIDLSAVAPARLSDARLQALAVAA
jgi:hypothetical protein